MTWNELTQKPHVCVNCRGQVGENIIIRNRCETCKVFTRPDLCPPACGRVGERAIDYCGHGFMRRFHEQQAIDYYQKTYPEQCRQLELF